MTKRYDINKCCKRLLIFTKNKTFLLVQMLYVCEIFSMVWYDYYMVLWVPKLNRRNEKNPFFYPKLLKP